MLELLSSSGFASLWGQTFEVGDLAVVAFLVLLEALLSADNALVLAIMVRHLPRDLQRKALLYGLGGAFVFRLVAILLAASIISLWWLQAIGALYLLFLPIKHFLHASSGQALTGKGGGFWSTVISVELADIAFAIDSVLAGVALIKSSEKIWVVYFGAIIGVVLLRFAAGFFVKLLERFPSLDAVAYVLVGWVGVKLAFMAGHNGTKALKTDFSVPEMSPYVFWSVLATVCVVGTLLAVRKQAGPEVPEQSSPSHEGPTPDL